MTDEKLTDDPRLARISRIEEKLVQHHIDVLPTGALVTDVPCGNGRMSQWAARRGDLRLVALDLDMAMLQSMAVRDAPSMLSARARADVLSLPLPDKCVDLFINMRLMHHIADHDTRVRMLREIARVTRGLIISSFWTTHCWRYVRRRILGKEIRGFPIPFADFRAACSQAGLTVQQIVPVRRWWEEQCLTVCRV